MNAFRMQRAMPRICRNCLVAVVLCLGTNTFAQSPHDSLHGAHEVFVSPDVAIVWAVLKAPTGDKAAVWLRIVNTKKKFSHISIAGVDPFNKKRKLIEPGREIETEVSVESDRETFTELPSREVYFYRTEKEWRADTPALTVYYLGVPDQTPEFTTRTAFDNYQKSVKLDPRGK